MARLYGTNNVNNCSYYCHQASGVGLNKSLGTGTATVTLEDVEQCDLVFVIGGNPASNHPRLLTSLNQLRRRGGKVIVINPVRELGMVNFRIPSDWRSMLWGSKIASHYYQPHIGGDLALLTGVSKAVLETGNSDIEFIQQYASEFESYRAGLESVSWTELEQKSGITEAQMREIANLYSDSKAAIFSWTMGITHHVHGV
jgi:anaerobic selenocysteine-containing dehydrogenase